MLALLANPVGRALLAGAVALALLAAVYAKGRADGSSACVTHQLVQSVKVEKRAQKARAKVRQSIPQTDDVETILQWLDQYAVPRY